MHKTCMDVAECRGFPVSGLVFDALQAGLCTAARNGETGGTLSGSWQGQAAELGRAASCQGEPATEVRDAVAQRLRLCYAWYSVVCRQ